MMHMQCMYILELGILQTHRLIRIFDGKIYNFFKNGCSYGFYLLQIGILPPLKSLNSQGVWALGEAGWPIAPQIFHLTKKKPETFRYLYVE